MNDFDAIKYGLEMDGILQNPYFQHLYTSLLQNGFEAWRHESDHEKREKLWNLIQGLQAVLTEMQAAAAQSQLMIAERDSASTVNAPLPG